MHGPPFQRLRPAAHHRDELAVPSVPGSGRHSSASTIPGSIHVHHPRLRRDRLLDLVGVARRRDARPDVKELPYSRLPGQVTDHAAQERPVRPRGEDQPRPDFECRLGPAGSISPTVFPAGSVSRPRRPGSGRRRCSGTVPAWCSRRSGCSPSSRSRTGRRADCLFSQQISGTGCPPPPARPEFSESIR